MVDLRAEREKRGLSLDEVSARVRIPVRYLVAMEAGDQVTLKPGPFRTQYQGQYLRFLGFPPDEPILDPAALEPEHDAPEDPTQTITVALEEVPLGRLVMSGFVLTMVIVLLLRLLFEVGSTVQVPEVATADAQDHALTSTVPGGATTSAEPEEPPQLAPGALPTSRLRIRAIEPTRITTRVDAQDSYVGVLPAGEIIDLEGSERIEVFSADLTTIRITYNGERIDPLGNLSKPRRLVFIQD